MFYQPGNDLVALSNSILKAYGIKTFHDSNRQIDQLLKANQVPKRKLCLILLDGFGAKIQEIYQHEAPYIYNHRKIEMTSVFPPTTAAATTSLLTGLYPCETGWLGWCQLFPKMLKPVDMFSSFYSDTQKPSGINTYKVLPLTFIDQLISRKHFKAKEIKSFEFPLNNFAQLIKAGSEALANNDFLYLYYTEPDNTLHEYGTGSEMAGKIVKMINDDLEPFVKAHPDVLFLTIADHGHTNISYYMIEEHQDFYSCLSAPFYSLEPRVSSFKVKKGKENEFAALANKYYGQDFYIYSKKEVKEKQVFGLGTPVKMFDDLLGDFILVAKRDKAFNVKFNPKVFKSHHGGSTQDEERLYLGVYNDRS
jgi:hypothetical protein